jgi:eukaryotic-like serine/threonine-protein kinase
MHASQKTTTQLTPNTTPSNPPPAQDPAQQPSSPQVDGAVPTASAEPAFPGPKPNPNEFAINAPPPGTRKNPSLAPETPQQPPQQVVMNPEQPPTPPGPSATGSSADEIRHARDRFSDLDARSQTISTELDHLRRQQEAQGYDLRGDVSASWNRMNNDLRDADRALNEHDMDAARDYMDKANEEMRKLEQFLGR